MSETMKVFKINARGVRELFRALKEVLPKEQAAEMHHALYRVGLKEWYESAWLLTMAEALEDAANEKGHGAVCKEICWFHPGRGVATVWADASWFDEKEIEA